MMATCAGSVRGGGVGGVGEKERWEFRMTSMNIVSRSCEIVVKEITVTCC